MSHANLIRLTHILVRVLFIALCTVCCPAIVRAADPVSIQDFIARAPQFDKLIGTTFILEGRASTLSGSDLRMRGTDLKFVFNGTFERPRTFPNVRITGRLERDTRGFQFIVTGLSDWKSESEVIRERLRAGDISDPAVYFKQAQWAEDRAKFYEDETLRAEARRLRSQGIQAAQKRAIDQPAELLTLATRATDWGLPNEQRMELLHAATRAELLAESRSTQPAYAMVLNKIRSRFGGADQPRNDIPDEVRTAYQQNPLAAYAAADADRRVQLQRLLYIETALKLAESDAKPDGSNGAQVAATIERLVPERPELAERYRESELAYLELQVPKMDRAAVLEFRNRLRALDQPDRATRVIRQWIDKRVAGRPRGPSSDVDRAEMEFEMAEAPERALELVTAAMNIDPSVPGGAELLSLMGYGWYQGKAIRKELIPARPADPFATAIQEGRILVGMSDSQVTAALGGAPDNIVRIASQGGVTELWHYPAQRVTLYLEGTRKKPQLQVSRIIELGARQP